MKKTIPFLSFALLSLFSQAQAIEPTPSSEIIKATELRDQLRKSSILKDYPFSSIGPVVQGGRVSDIEVFSSNKQEFLVAYASGGVFYTNNDGIGFQPIFDNQGALTIGDMAIFENDEQRVIWVGTGENNSSRSSYAGCGIYKSSDLGKTWQHCGLEGVQHTGKIITHPSNPEIVWIAAMGALYSPSEDRGIYKTTDGGKSWKKTLYINESTGAIDLIIHPENPDMLWASMWERKRKAWEFVENGPGTGIYVSRDGGMNWSPSNQGMPDREFKGRIGLSICSSDPNIMYASLDNQEEKKKEEKEDRPKSGYRSVDFLDMSSEAFLRIPAAKIDSFLRENRYPDKYDAELVRSEIRNGKYEPKAIANYFGDANEALFNAPVIGAEVYRSEDMGNTWKKVNQTDLYRAFYSYGYYFGEIRVSPKDPEKVYLLGVPLVRSMDGGKTFSLADTFVHVHGDHQALWIDPDNDDHLLCGSDGGLYQSYDGGAMWRNLQSLSVGQFYSVAYDFDQPYNVYGGLQDNGVLYGSSNSRPNYSNKWQWIFGGDGMMVQINPENSDEIYTGYQFGNYYRISRSESAPSKRVVPVHDIGEPTLRFNWRTPILLSQHNNSIFYIGAQRLYKSLNKGDDYKAISPDLTRNLPSENVPYSTITVIEESPFDFAKLYVGTDDGNVQVSDNGGGSWSLRTKGLPDKRWVSSIYPSKHEKNKIYVSLTGYREDEFLAYVYKSTDDGKTWSSISNGLPNECVNKIIEDPVVPGLLFLGTDHATYCSMDDGRSWTMLSDLPNVAAYDLAIHPREHDLLVGTHGRSIYKSNIENLRSIATQSEKHLLFKTEDLRGREYWEKEQKTFRGPWVPKIQVCGYNPDGRSLSVFIENDEQKQFLAGQTESKGYWTLSLKPEVKDKKGNAKLLEKGKYRLILKSGKETLREQDFRVRD